MLSMSLQGCLLFIEVISLYVSYCTNDTSSFRSCTIIMILYRFMGTSNDGQFPDATMNQVNLTVSSLYLLMNPDSY